MPCLLPLCLVPRLRQLALAVLTASFWISPGHAQDSAALWSVKLLGVKIGELDLSYDTTQSTYRGQAQFQTTGVAGAVAKVRFDLRGSGVQDSGGLHADFYREDMNTGRRHSTAEVRFRNERSPQVTGRLDTAHTADLSQMTDPLDPFSAMLTVLRAQPQAPTCHEHRDVFDGARLTRLVLTPHQRSSDKVVCKGAYQRISGYSAEQLAETDAFSLRLTYEPTDQGWRLSRAKIGTLYGPAALKLLK